MVTRDVKKNVTNKVTNQWTEALRDAEAGLEKAQRAVASWKATIQTCRKKIAAGAPWPGQLTDQNSEQQHSV